jgi:hypothetical protein
MSILCRIFTVLHRYKAVHTLKIKVMIMITDIKSSESTQILELQSKLDKEVSQNYSPTLRAKLIKVGKRNCVFESVPSPYGEPAKTELTGVKYKIPNWIAWNSFFF